MSGLTISTRLMQATFVDGDEPSLLLWQAPEGSAGPQEAVGARQSPAELAKALGIGEGTRAEEILAVPAAWTTARVKDDRLRLATVAGWRVSVAAAAPTLAAMSLDVPEQRAPAASVQAWAAAAKLALELVASHAVVPWVDGSVEPGTADGAPRARWRVCLDAEHRSRLESLARSLPVAARAWAGAESTRGPARLLRSEVALRRFVDTVADARLRAAGGKAGSGRSWIDRLVAALVTAKASVETRKVVETSLPAALRTWVEPGLGEAEASPVRLGLRLAPPDLDDDPGGEGVPAAAGWSLVLMAQAARDPSLIVDAAKLWADADEAGRAFRELAEAPQERLLLEIDRAARLWPPIGRALEARLPERLELSLDETAELILEASSLLRSAGFLIVVPPELSVSGRQRLRARLRASGRSGAAAGGSRVGMGFAQVIQVSWETALGDTTLTLEELQELARLKQPLVRWRGEWVMLDTGDLDRLVTLAESRPETLEGAAVLRAALTGRVQTRQGEMPVVLDDAPEALETLERLRAAGSAPVEEVPGLVGELRPYQARGVAWLEQLGALGLGACLADDMGLGKTVEVIAYLLRRRRETSVEAGPSLLVCPTSVLGNWERELTRFGPGIPVVLHYGPVRAADAGQLQAALSGGPVLLTTYGLLRRDRELLAGIEWDVVVLDEAQAIKNHQSVAARAACSLPARHRLALTGTPVENRLADLWSIFAYCNPGLLPGITSFMKALAFPIERFRDEHALAELQRLTAPFILRRTKDDPTILPDLPPKVVLASDCPLTREQATLYQATLDAALEELESAEGMNRRGKVLRLITALKQICNHPAQLLGGGGRLDGRSGKLERLLEVLEAVTDERQAALIFTQYRVMGELLVRAIEERLAFTPPFIHGGVARAERERLVDAFQGGTGPPAMVITVKAGGTGLNLTRASHVVHFDRWWNPAVEQQATDRAHRIGQSRTVMVHTLICRGTLEERIDRMLEDKAELARLAVGGGESWLTELDDDQLRDMLRLDLDRAVEDEP